MIPVIEDELKDNVAYNKELSAKYSLGQKVYIINNNKVCHGIIVKVVDVHGLNIENKKYQYIYYAVRPLTDNIYPSEIGRDENEIFLTKDDIISKIE